MFKQLLQSKLLWYYILAFTTALLVLYSYHKYTTNFVFLLPIALVVVLIAISRIDLLLYFIAFAAPLSLQFTNLSYGSTIDFYIPTEPLIVGLLLVFIIKLANKNILPREVIRHPISIAIGIQLLWMLITTITSSMVSVSVKYLLVRIWFLVCFYVFFIQLFRKNINNFHRIFWAYAAGMVIVIIYTLMRHMSYGLFDDEAAHFVMSPFFRDHTSYGAVLAFLIPVAIGYLFMKGSSANVKYVSLILVAILSVALILSYTRAAWLSVIVAAAFLMLVLFKMRFRGLMMLIVCGGVFLSIAGSSLLMNMESNNQDSSANNVGEHVQSVSNISTDASNVERINRWASAIRMFKERPILGWGPGTYMFQYAPFQMSKEKTVISTNFGDGGNAHSEYIGPLSESGIFGTLTMLILVFVILQQGMKTYYSLNNRRYRIMVLTALLGLITYFFHGLLNNFLDTDKVSLLFWGYAALIVSIDLNNKKEVAGN